MPRRMRLHASTIRHGWNNSRRWYNREGFGMQVFRFVVPRFTAKEFLGIVACFIVVVYLYVHARNHVPPATPAPSPSVSTSVTPRATTGALGVRTTAGNPIGTANSPPPSGLPTNPGSGLPPAGLTASLVRFLDAYYYQATDDTPASYIARVKAVTPPAVLKTLDLSIGPQGTVTGILPDWATLKSQAVGNQGQQYVTLTIHIGTESPDGSATGFARISHSTWQPQGKGWLLVMYTDKTSASGR